MRIALQGGHVVTGTGETIDGGVVVLDGDRIDAVGGAGLTTNAEHTVDLEGRTLKQLCQPVHQRSR